MAFSACSAITGHRRGSLLSWCSFFVVHHSSTWRTRCTFRGWFRARYIRLVQLSFSVSVATFPPFVCMVNARGWIIDNRRLSRISFAFEKGKKSRCVPRRGAGQWVIARLLRGGKMRLAIDQKHRVCIRVSMDHISVFVRILSNVVFVRNSEESL